MDCLEAIKRKNVTGALQQRPELSDGAIAEHCGVSQPFVGKLRAELAPTHNGYESKERVGADGRKYDMTNLSKSVDDEPLVDPPEEHDDDPQDDAETVLLQQE